MIKHILVSFLVYQLLIPATLFAGACSDTQLAQGYKDNYGRCVQGQEILARETAQNACLGSDDPQECFKARANKDQNSRLNQSQNDYNTSGFGDFGQAMLHVAVLGISAYVINFWTARKKGKYANGTGDGENCKPASMYLMSAAAAALVLAEVISYTTYMKKMKERKAHLQELMSQSVSEDDETSKDLAMKNFTLIAYDSIIYQEKAYLAATKTRRTGYAVATGAFAGAAIAAGVGVAKKISLKAQIKRKDTAISYKERAGEDASGLRNERKLLDKEHKKLVCKRRGKGQYGKIGKKNGSNGGSSLLNSLAPVLLGKFLTSTDFNKTSDEYYTFMQNPFSPNSFKKLSTQLKHRLSNIQQTTSLNELTTIIQEREELAAGGLSSPSLNDYLDQEKSFSSHIGQNNFNSMKQAYMMSEAFRGELALIKSLSRATVSSL